MIGKTISHYKILEKLGEGGMGVVYKAEDTKLDRTVAIKFLPRQVAASAQQRQRFTIEAKAAATLNHPNIATIHAIEEADDEAFIVMEYVEGQELKNIVGVYRDTPLPIEQILNIAIQIAEGLQAAHKKGIVHRDIKSTNIMLTESGQVKIMDFGLAKVRGGAQVTKVGTIVGTAAYMSPEQARGDDVDHRTDIWSFGVVLYEVLAGRLPFKSDYEQAVMYSIVNEDPEPLTHVRTGVPTELGRIVTKAMAKRSEQRYQQIDEILVDLKSLKRQFLSGKVQPSGSRSSLKLQRLAVLPFANLRSDPQTDFLGFAIADQTIGALDYIKNILVRPSSAVRQYQNQTVDAPTAGRDLQVDFVLAGYYLKESDVVRLNVELVNVHSNEMVWRESIEVKYENAFKLQDIVSEKVMHGLEIQFSHAERGRMQTDVPQNPLGYEYFLRSISYPHTNEGDQLAIEMLQKSVDLDSSFAPAYAELGSRLQSYGTFALQGAEAYKQAEESYLKALSLNGELLSALGGSANLYTDIGKTEKALDYAKQMLRINPNHALAHYSLSYILRYAGMLEESEKEVEKALALDPKNAKFRSAGYTYFYMGNYEKAIEIFELDKGSVMAIAWKGFALYLMGKRKEAIKHFDQAISLEPEGHFGYHFGAVRAAELGKKEEGLLNARLWEDANPYDAEVWYNLANSYALLGDKSGCQRALKRTVEGGFFVIHIW